MASYNRESLDTIEVFDGGCSFAAPRKASRGGDSFGDAERMSALRRTIESQIIPRLMLACRETALSATAVVSNAFTLQDRVPEFTSYLLDGDMTAVAGVVGRAVQEGASQSAVMLDLFAPAALRLGELWESDERDFAEITFAMGCLQQALHIFEPPGRHLPSAASQRTIFLTPCDGEQHYFGVQLLDIFFSGADWNVTSRLVFDRKQTAIFLTKRRVDVLGFSISRESLLDQLASDIELLRRKSRNEALVVLVGGRVFADQPELVKRVGADATAVDAGGAVLMADRLVLGQRVATA